MKPFTIIECAQRSPEWYQVRAGRVTGSVADAVLAKGRGGEESTQRRNLRTRLALERFIGRAIDEEKRVSQAMQDGIDREDAAIQAYEASAELVERTGFLRHNELMIGTSLDGHVGDFEGNVEVKCPIHFTHFNTILNRTIESGYMRQIIHGQLVTGAQWTDYVSYHPDFGPLSLCVIRVPRDQAVIDAYRVALVKFLAEVDAEHAELVKLAEGVA